MTSKLNEAVLLRSNDHNRSDKPELSYSQLKNSAQKRITDILPFHSDIHEASVTDIIGLANGNILFNGLFDKKETIGEYNHLKATNPKCKSIPHTALNVVGTIAAIAALEDRVFAFTTVKDPTESLLILKDSKVEHKLTKPALRIRTGRTEIYGYSSIGL